MHTDYRYDRAFINTWDELPDGRLRAVATVSRVGDLRYLLSDGSVRVETLTADELFKTDSLDTAGLATITLGHPPEGLVNPKNYKKYSVGASGNKVVARQDVGLVDIVFMIGDEEAIDSVKNKNVRQVSAGYTTNVERRSDGKFYQTNRRYNHFALVEKGRAGEDVCIHLDSGGWGIQLDQENEDCNMDMPKGKKKKLAEMSESDLEMMQDELDAAKAKIDMYEKRKDTADQTASELADKYVLAKAQVDSLRNENEQLKGQLATKMDEAELERQIQDRLSTWEKAKQHLPETVKFDAAETPLAMKLKAVKAVNPSLNLDSLRDEFGDRFPVYVQALFDNLSSLSLQTQTAKKNDFAEELEAARISGGRNQPSLIEREDEDKDWRVDQAAAINEIESAWKQGAA